HFFTHIPHPIHRNSEMKAILSVDLTSIQSLPDNTEIISFWMDQRPKLYPHPFSRRDMTIRQN
ncbi:hypothetical protein BJ138DRAFT_1014755, partial [Hygrophoropsis aurantiaca]